MAFVPASCQPVYQSGYPVDEAHVFAFDAGTSTPRDLFLTADIDPSKVHPVPVVTEDGVLPVMYAGPGDYDLQIVLPDGGQIRRLSNLPGDPVADDVPGTFDPQAQFVTGDVVTAHRTGFRAGWLALNGLTIGSAASPGTARANADCHALFVHLWTYDVNLVVAGASGVGRGPTAEADWSANKTIALPDDQGRGDFGCLDMGNASASSGRLNGAVLGTTGAVLGGTGGEAAHTLATAEMGGVTSVATAGTTQILTAAGAAAHNTLPPAIFRTRYIKL